MKVEKIFWDADGANKTTFTDEEYSKLMWLDKKKIRKQRGYEFNKRIIDLF